MNFGNKISFVELSMAVISFKTLTFRLNVKLSVSRKKLHKRQILKKLGCDTLSVKWVFWYFYIITCKKDIKIEIIYLIYEEPNVIIPIDIKLR